MKCGITVVGQYNDFSCFVACLESIKRDWGDPNFRHEKFVKDNLDIFNGGDKHEGLCQNPEEACARAGLKFEMIYGDFSFEHSDAAVLLFIWSRNEEKNKHFVRLVDMYPEKVKVMNPSIPNCYDCIPHEWIKSTVKITKP